MRLAIIVTHPVQYFAPVFRGLAALPGMDVMVFFGCDHGAAPALDLNFGRTFAWDSSPTEGFDSIVIAPGDISKVRGWRGIKNAFKLMSELRRFSPDAVLVFSYTPSFILWATALIALWGKPLMLRAETSDRANSRPLLKRVIRDVFLRFYYRWFESVFPIGSDSCDHYVRLGVPLKRQFLAKYAVDFDFFEKQAEDWRPKRVDLRAKFSIPAGDRVVVYCGKMFPPKDPLLIPRALALLPEEATSRLWLLAVGDGVLRSDFEALAKKSLGKRAIFVGFKNQSEIGQYYSMSDFLILPSIKGETWGLVVNEALQFGLRVIVSDRVGCSRDLVDGKNCGEVFSAGDPDSLATAIVRTLALLDAASPVSSELPKPSDFVESVRCALFGGGADSSLLNKPPKTLNRGERVQDI